MEPQYSLFSASMPSRPYYLGPSRNGEKNLILKGPVSVSHGKPSMGIPFVPKTSLTAHPHALAAWCSLCPSPFHKWVAIFFLKSRCHSVVPDTTSNQKANSAIIEHCAQQVSQDPGNANWSFKKMRRFLEDFVVFWRVPLGRSHTVTSSFQILTIHSHLLQRTDFSHLTIHGSCPCSFSPKSWKEFGIMIPRQTFPFPGACELTGRHRQEVRELHWRLHWSWKQFGTSSPGNAFHPSHPTGIRGRKTNSWTGSRSLIL